MLAVDLDTTNASRIREPEQAVHLDAMWRLRVQRLGFPCSRGCCCAGQPDVGALLTSFDHISEPVANVALGPLEATAPGGLCAPEKSPSTAASSTALGELRPFVFVRFALPLLSSQLILQAGASTCPTTGRTDGPAPRAAQTL